jgi:hypothetical protein
MEEKLKRQGVLNNKRHRLVAEAGWVCKAILSLEPDAREIALEEVDQMIPKCLDDQAAEKKKHYIAIRQGLEERHPFGPKGESNEVDESNRLRRPNHATSCFELL